MIVRHTTAGTLVDCTALFIHFGRRLSERTIRARCTPVGKDPATGLLLYDLDAAEEDLAGVKPRNPHTRRRRSGGEA